MEVYIKLDRYQGYPLLTVVSDDKYRKQKESGRVVSFERTSESVKLIRNVVTLYEQLI